jgi:hypothetical protein
LREDRRLQKAAETLENVRREMNLAAEQALAMQEQQSSKQGSAQGKAVSPKSTGEVETAGAQMPAASTSLTERIRSFEKIAAAAEVEGENRYALIEEAV